MSKVPCRKCKQCGRYSDMASLICVCGAELRNIPGELIETSDLSEEMIADIDEEIEVYVQKCSACGALNFSISDDEPVKMCRNCHKVRIATVVPVKYVRCELFSKADSDVSDIFETTEINSTTNDSGLDGEMTKNITDDDEDEVNDAETSFWINLKGGVENGYQTLNEKYSSDDDDDIDAGIWDGVVDNNTQSETESPVIARKSELTIIAVRHGQLSYTINSGDVPLLLGRDANLKDFLAYDQRISNEHLYIDYENDNWLVRDNNSSNGTAVNSKDIGYGGKMILKNGDLLKLGHHPDSMEFKVLIE